MIPFQCLTVYACIESKDMSYYALCYFASCLILVRFIIPWYHGLCLAYFFLTLENLIQWCSHNSWSINFCWLELSTVTETLVRLYRGKLSAPQTALYNINSFGVDDNMKCLLDRSDIGVQSMLEFSFVTRYSLMCVCSFKQKPYSSLLLF